MPFISKKNYYIYLLIILFNSYSPVFSFFGWPETDTKKAENQQKQEQQSCPQENDDDIFIRTSYLKLERKPKYNNNIDIEIDGDFYRYSAYNSCIKNGFIVNRNYSTDKFEDPICNILKKKLHEIEKIRNEVKIPGKTEYVIELHPKAHSYSMNYTSECGSQEKIESFDGDAITLEQAHALLGKVYKRKVQEDKKLEEELIRLNSLPIILEKAEKYILETKNNQIFLTIVINDSKYTITPTSNWCNTIHMPNQYMFRELKKLFQIIEDERIKQNISRHELNFKISIFKNAADVSFDFISSQGNVICKSKKFEGKHTFDNVYKFVCSWYKYEQKADKTDTSHNFSLITEKALSSNLTLESVIKDIDEDLEENLTTLKRQLFLKKLLEVTQNPPISFQKIMVLLLPTFAQDQLRKEYSKINNDLSETKKSFTVHKENLGHILEAAYKKCIDRHSTDECASLHKKLTEKFQKFFDEYQAILNQEYKK